MTETKIPAFTHNHYQQHRDSIKNRKIRNKKRKFFDLIAIYRRGK
jgi:hypothetical protein